VSGDRVCSETEDVVDNNSVSFSAKFDITITVPIGVWGDDTNFKEMRQQLTREAEQKLRHDLKGIDYTVHKVKLTSIQGVEQ
jgi:hypothetical protein